MLPNMYRKNVFLEEDRQEMTIAFLAVITSQSHLVNASLIFSVGNKGSLMFRRNAYVNVNSTYLIRIRIANNNGRLLRII